jgi:hypothetical protein
MPLYHTSPAKHDLIESKSTCGFHKTLLKKARAYGELQLSSSIETGNPDYVSTGKDLTRPPSQTNTLFPSKSISCKLYPEPSTYQFSTPCPVSPKWNLIKNLAPLLLFVPTEDYIILNVCLLVGGTGCLSSKEPCKRYYPHFYGYSLLSPLMT